MPYPINNPGGGNCGFYAFAIGLIDVIQQEYNSSANSQTFNRWQKEGLNGIRIQDILGINLYWLAYSPFDYKNEKLNELQQSLRSIAAKIYKEDLLDRMNTELKSVDEHTKIEGSHVYGKFMELVQFYLKGESTLDGLRQYNELALSDEVLKLAQNTADELQPELKEQSFDQIQKIENAYVKQCLILELLSEDGLNQDSALFKGIEQIKKEGRWATHADLTTIADKLHINFNVVDQANGAATSDYPTVVLKNENNIHWLTIIEEKEPVLSKTHQREGQKFNTLSGNYRNQRNTFAQATTAQGLFAHARNNIPTNTIDNSTAIEHEYDQSLALATRLQQEEIEDWQQDYYDNIRSYFFM